MTRLALRLFGPIEIKLNGEPVSGLESDKVRALLIFLAVASARPHRREKLAALLWPDWSERSARANLRRALANLRKALGDCKAAQPFLLVTRQTIQFNRDSDAWVDAIAITGLLNGGSPRPLNWSRNAPADTQTIRQLEDAVELYRGEFLEGFSPAGIPAFDEWAMVQQEQYHRQVMDTLCHLGCWYEDRGEWEQALQCAWRQVESDPWREGGHRQAMRLLAHSGQRSAALIQYSVCRQVLDEELGVKPEEKTVQLYERIRDGTLAAPTVVPTKAPEPEFAPRLPAFLEEDEKQRHILPPFVARERELAQLDRHLEKALAQQGRVVFVTGEAGTGKTALVQTFAKRAQERHPGLVVAGGNCNAYTGVGDPYLPFREILGSLTGDVESRWAAGDIGLERARRLWNLVPHVIQLLMKAGPDLIDVFVAGPVLADRAVAAAPSGARWPERLEELLANRERRQSQTNLQQADVFEQYTAVLKGLARQHPLLLVVDDLQWADGGSIGLLFHLGRRLAGSPILVVGIYRPAEVALGRDGSSTDSTQRERHPLEPVVHEFQRDWGQIHVDLRQSADRQFVEALMDTEPNRFGDKFRHSLYQQTRGHALFTVEMLRGMQERGDLVQDKAGRWVEGPAVDWETLPARVEGIIAERISRLPVALQEMLKVASVEGEEFTAEVVAQVRGAGEPETIGLLSGELAKQHRLVRGQGSQRSGSGGQRVSRYRFRHILFQKHIYNNLDEAERAYLHEAVGKALEQLYEGHTEPVAIQLARHFEAAGLKLQAADYLEKATSQATRSYAYQEAILIFDRAVALLKSLPDTPERAQRELTVQIGRGSTLITVQGFASPEVGQAYTRAQELSQQADARAAPEFFPVLWGLWANYFTRGEHQAGRELGEQLLDLAQRARDRNLLLQAHHSLWTTCYFVGVFDSAREHMEQGLAVYDQQQHHSHAFVYGGHDPGLCSLTLSGPVLWCLGYPEQALQKNNQAMTMAEELCHPGSQVLTQTFLATLAQLRRDARAVQALTEATIAQAAEHGFPFWTAWADSLQGWALAQQGHGEEGVIQVRRGIATFQATGAAHDVPHQLALLAETYQTTGQTQEALKAVDEALAAAHDAGGCYYEAEMHRLKGELLLAYSKGAAVVEAETCFHQAIEVARRQNAKSWELRAVTSLSRLWQRKGKRVEALQMLAEIYDWFTEGFDTVDLREAKALLKKLMMNIVSLEGVPSSPQIFESKLSDTPTEGTART